MKIITSTEALGMNYKTKKTSEKSLIRRMVEDMLVGQIAKFEGNGVDYKNWSQIYTAVYNVTEATPRTYELKQVEGEEAAVLTRLS